MARLLSACPSVLFAARADESLAATFISDNVVAMLGYDPHAFLADPSFWRERIHPDDRDWVGNAIRFEDSLHGKVFEFRFRHQDGRYRWLRSEVKLIRDGSGAPLEVVGSWSDITEAKTVEEALVQRERTLAAAERIAHVGGWEMDAATMGVTWSDELYAIHGVPRDQTVTLDRLITFFHPDDREHCGREVQRALSDGTDFDIQHRLIHQSDGTVRWVHARGEHIRDSDGKIIRIVGTVQDITSRHHAESRILDLSSFAETVVAQSALGILVYRASGACVLVNEALATLVGAPIATLKQQSFRDLDSWKDSGVLAAAERALACGVPQPVQCEITSSFGRKFWVNASLSPFSVSGEDFLLVEFHDITQQKKAELAIIAAMEQAEASNRAKSEFLAGMSHELRTPLNAVIGFSDAILSDIFGAGFPPRYRDYVSGIKDSGLHLLDIVNDILDCSAIEAGKLELHWAVIDTAELVASSIRLVRPHTDAKRLGVTVDLAEAPLHLWADERRLKQILVNLLGNAVKFTAEHGLVTLRVTAPARGGIILSITDTGIGMDATGIAKALTLFGQVDSTLARQYEGTGLGLPLSQRLAEAHGGRLEITSVPDQGTTVAVILPPVCVARAG